jgi:hypothetical protein
MTLDQVIPANTQPSARPVVYGYLRTATQEPAEAAGYECELVAWCEREGWQLGAVFRDVGIGPDVLIRPGFAAVLDVLGLPGSSGVVVLDSGHLSTLGSVAKVLRSAIRRTGAVLFIRGEIVATEPDADDELAEVDDRRRAR